MALNLDAEYPKEGITDAISDMSLIIMGQEINLRTFSLLAFSKSMPTETLKGWRTKTFYRHEKGQTFELVGVRRTKRGALMYRFAVQVGPSSETLIAEIHADEGKVLFGDSFEKFINDTFGGSIKDVIKRYIATGSVASMLEYTTAVTPPEPPKKLTAADIYSGWGDWA